MIGAQPGAGKTSLQCLASTELLQNAVICNPDHLRSFHPVAGEILQRHEKYFTELTNDCARQWNLDLVRHCRRNNLNYIHESTFNFGDELNRTIRATKRSGFEVEIKILAVDAKLSRLGIHLRYEEMKRLNGVARNVPMDFHDLRFMGLPPAIKKVHEAGIYDDLNIYARSIVLDGPQLTNGLTLVARNTTDPFGVYMNEVNRPWSQNLTQYFHEKCDRVLHLMGERNAPQMEIDAFKRNVGIAETSKRRVRIHV